MPTIKQRQAFKKVSESIGNKQPISIGKAMRESGYSQSTSKTPQRLTDSKGWKELLAAIDDNEILEKIYSILMDSDKRSALSAADMLLKLKDKYPQKASKLVGLFEDV